MSKWKFAIGLVAMLCVAALLVGQVYSQAGGGRGAGGRGGRGGGMRGGGFNFEEMQQRMMDRMKESLEADDAQWTKMKPLLMKVMELQRELRSGSRFGMFGRGGFMRGRGAGGGEGRGPGTGPGRGSAAGAGRGPGAGQGRDPGARQERRPRGDRPERPQTDIQKKSQALQESLEDMLAEDAKVKKQLLALRTAKKKVKTELEKTQLALAKIVKSRQEARLVLMGYLE